ncbi:head-tail connector protein [Jiella sonneratiae]|uniref:Phage head-tail connector protein n=1 Tax=Jiella sonneratiae TaxID=2816856 RepID=A0ABS3J8L7_9HYPH|nr:phage head-tail connector protein [Jiella sonneratiae]MBO0904916.1 phage head-tail connector protein [Jiella sonneratiae]
MTTIDLGPVAEPLTLADAKIWARIERDDEDGLIARLIAAGREAIERDTGLALVARSFRLTLDPAPCDGWVEATRRPLVSVDTVTAYDAAGNPRVFEPAEAIVERPRGTDGFRLAPAVLDAASNGVEIEFVAGYGDADRPAELILALKAIVAASYEARALVEPGMQPALRPAIAERLIAPHRRVRI